MILCAYPEVLEVEVEELPQPLSLDLNGHLLALVRGTVHLHNLGRSGEAFFRYIHDI